MKLATLNNGKRDGALVVVSRDLARAVHVTTIAPPCSRPSTSGEKWRRNWRRLSATQRGRLRRRLPLR
jgi:hypothetical protein